MKQLSKPNRHGFTLVELLVVIGIIALLISILLPALSKARKQANTVKCMAQQKQLIQSIVMYSNDWKGALPWTTWGTCGYPGWLYDGGNLTPKFFSVDDLKLGTLWYYLGVAKIYRCPQDTGPWVQQQIQNISSYVMNGSLNDFRGYNQNDAVPSREYRITKFKPDTAVLWEIGSRFGGGVSNDAVNYPDESITIRHQNQTTISFLDGHVEVWSLELYLKHLNLDGNSLGGSQLWRAPGPADGGRNGRTWTKATFPYQE